MPPDEQSKQLLKQAFQASLTYLQQRPSTAVTPNTSQSDLLGTLGDTIPQQSVPATDVLHQLAELGESNSVRTTGGRYFGFVNGGILPVALAASWLVDTWNQNAALHVMSPLASQIEMVCERWLIDLFGLPKHTVASFVTGSSAGNLCALAAARHQILKRHDWNVEQQGLQGAPAIRIVASASVHSSIAKAIAVLGLGTVNVIDAPVDKQGRVDSKQLPKLDANTIVLLQAGNVNSGSFDPFYEICNIAKAAGAWVHIDGAFGLWAAATDDYSYLCKGIELADSWVTDAHKTLNAGYDGGIVFCKHPADLQAAMAASGSYIQYSEQRDPMTMTLEMSRRARAIQIWAVLNTLGKNGINSLVAQLCQRAKLFAELLAKEGFIIDNEVVFNQVLIRLENDEATLALLEQIQESGELWCGGASWRGNQVIRISICSWMTTVADVEKSVRIIVESK